MSHWSDAFDVEVEQRMVRDATDWLLPLAYVVPSPGEQQFLFGSGAFGELDPLVCQKQTSGQTAYYGMNYRLLVWLDEAAVIDKKIAARVSSLLRGYAMMTTADVWSKCKDFKPWVRVWWPLTKEMDYDHNILLVTLRARFALPGALESLSFLHFTDFTGMAARLFA